MIPVVYTRQISQHIRLKTSERR